MKKIDLHIHTVQSVSDHPFDFSIDSLESYVINRKIDCIAITNHNLFDKKQFDMIKEKINIILIDHQAQGEKYNSDNSKILDNFSESIGKDFVMYFEIFSIICVPVYL